MSASIRLGTSTCVGVLAIAVMLSGCGGSSSSPSPQTVTTPAPATSSISHDRVFIVVLENHPFASVIGNPAMPYLNSLARSFGLATNYFANAHPSLPNYFILTAGQPETSSDDFTDTVSDDNVVRELVAAGKSWRSYAQSLPSVGYTGGDQGPYIKHHNPITYFTDVLNSSAQANNIVPFTQFSADLQNGSLPNYSFIVPDNQHNSHDCPGGGSNCTDNQKLAASDAWLQANMGPLISSASFQAGGLLIIVFDESDVSDVQSGGGRVAAVIVSSKAKPGFQSTTFFQHQSTLRLMLRALGVTALPGASANAPDMDEFFK